MDNIISTSAVRTESGTARLSSHVIRPKVTVIIAVYKAEQWIERCCRTLFGQTLDSIEYIFVNDCTPDGSMEVVQCVLNDYPHRRDQVRVINHERNQGVAAARQHGTDAATGEYIIHCDPDDWVELDMYETMYETAIREGVRLVTCDFDNIKSNGLILIDRCCPERLTGISLLEGISGVAFHRLHGSLWNKLISSACYTFTSRFPEGVSYCEDVCMLFQLLPHVDCIGYINRVMYHYNKKNENCLTARSDFNQVERVIGWVDSNVVTSLNQPVANCGRAFVALRVLGIALTPSELSSAQFKRKYSCYIKYLRNVRVKITPSLLLQIISISVDYRMALTVHGWLRRVKRKLFCLKGK